jgi:hypothetical protein
MKMFKNTNLVALGFGTVAVCSILALVVLSPVSASAVDTSAGYLPEQIVNQGQRMESVPADAYGDTGLYSDFPKEEPVSLLDAAPEMYN